MKFYTLLLNKYETLTMSAHNFFRTAKLFGIIFVPFKNLKNLTIVLVTPNGQKKSRP